jgi:hypothetical protein
MYKLIRHTLGFFVSLRTTLWSLLFLLIMLLGGACIMPLKEEFQSIHSLPLFGWMKEQPLGITWWLWASVGLLSVLTANTLFCSIESVIRKRRNAQWLLLISPQIIHIGFLVILLAHFLSAMGSFKGMAVAREGASFNLPNNTTLQVRSITISVDSYGYVSDWAVDVAYLSEGRMVHEELLMPNRPSLREGLGVYVKDLRASPEKTVLLEITREPGAPWALAGGVLFLSGTVMLVLLKTGREGRSEAG